MLGTPKKGRRFGGSSAHQKAMMGNLVASLVAAEYLVTTEAKAKALRPVAEKVITAAAKGGVARQRNVVAFIRDKDFDRLVLEIETDGSLTPREALASAGDTLHTLVGLVADLEEEPMGLELGEVGTIGTGSPDLDL